MRMLNGFGDGYAQLAEAGWQGLTAPEKFGGMGLSHLVCNLVPGAISTLLTYGTDAQQAHWIPKLADGSTLSTMCLTEAGAGSDLSAIRTTATQDGDTWCIDGGKIFISGGDQEMSQRILHLVLARTGTREDGFAAYPCFCTNSRLGFL